MPVSLRATKGVSNVISRDAQREAEDQHIWIPTKSATVALSGGIVQEILSNVCGATGGHVVNTYIQVSAKTMLSSLESHMTFTTSWIMDYPLLQTQDPQTQATLKGVAFFLLEVPASHEVIGT